MNTVPILMVLIELEFNDRHIALVKDISISSYDKCLVKKP